MEKSQSYVKVWKLCCQGNLIVAAQQTNLPVIYSFVLLIHFSYAMFTENLH